MASGTDPVHLQYSLMTSTGDSPVITSYRIRPDVQPRLDTSLPRAAARLPCRTSSWSHRRGGQLRRGGCASAQRLVWIGGGGVGASLHPALAGRLIETDERIERRAALPVLVSRGKKGQPGRFIIGDRDLVKL